MSYVFPASVRAQLAVAIAFKLEEYLRQGSFDFNLTGLDASPLFVTRPGRGGPGDEPVVKPAKIIYPDDEPPGIPSVGIFSVVPSGSPQDWGEEEEVSQWKVTLDCNANEFSGTITTGNAPGGADTVLSEAVWHLLSHYDAMHTAGFVNANATPGAGDVQGIDYHIPITLTFEVYVLKV